MQTIFQRFEWKTALRGIVMIACCTRAGGSSLVFNPGSVALVAGNGTSGDSGDGQLATSAQFREPGSVAVDVSGNIYVADTENNQIRRIDAQTRNISRFAGTGSIGYSGDDGPATNAVLCQPRGLIFDSAQNLWFADSCNNVIRRISPAGVISTVAGKGPGRNSAGLGANVGDGGPATLALLAYPNGMATDTSGAIYIADTGHHRVRRIDPNGNIYTVAGTGVAGSAVDGSLAAQSRLNSPASVAVNRRGVLYIADTGNNLVRRVDPQTGSISTVAGGGTGAGTDTLGDSGPALQATLDAPMGLAFDARGNLLIADSGNDLIRKLDSASGSIMAIVGIDPVRWKAITSVDPPMSLRGDTSALDLDIWAPNCIALDSNGKLYVADTGNAQVWSVDFQVPVVSLLASKTTSLSITNAGQAAVALGNFQVNGANSSDFSIVGTSCLGTLLVDATCNVQVSFSGDRAELEQASLDVTDSDGNPVASAPIDGVSGQAEASSNHLVLSPALLSFVTGENKSATSTLTITNNGSSYAALMTPSLTGSDAEQFRITDSTCSSSLAPDETCVVSVAFAPQTTGSYSANLIVTGSDTVVLSGVANGGPPVSNSSSGLQFVPITPCRVADTRGPNSAFGGPRFAGNETRSFAIAQSICNIPTNAAAYALNVTAVPAKTLGYLSIWPAGQPQPRVSTLNSWDGSIKANASIVGAGTAGAVDIYVSDPSDVVLDVNGYFVPRDVASGLNFFPITPCRVMDTRASLGDLTGPSFSANETRSVPLLSGPCQLPSIAQAYSLNITVVPKASLGYLSVWPTGEPKPLVSTLNSFNGKTTSNAAVVPAGSNGDISLFVTGATDVIIDVNGYFATPSQGGLTLYPIPPCRALDSREAGFGLVNGTFTISVEKWCELPSAAEAYVANATVIPSQPVGYLALWPDGQSQPGVSTLNAWDGQVKSNMAIVPATNGIIDGFLTQSANVVFDVNGYFAP